MNETNKLYNMVNGEELGNCLERLTFKNVPICTKTDYIISQIGMVIHALNHSIAYGHEYMYLTKEDGIMTQTMKDSYQVHYIDFSNKVECAKYIKYLERLVDTISEQDLVHARRMIESRAKLFRRYDTLYLLEDGRVINEDTKIKGEW